MDDQGAWQVLLGHSDFTVLDGILYRIVKDKTLRIVPPKSDHYRLYLEVHGDSGHL